MSISVMSLVWKRANVSDYDLLILLALADWADDDGENCYPKIDTISLKTRISRRTVFDSLKRLEKDKYITRISGPGAGHKNEYIVNISLLESLPPKYEERKAKRADTACLPIQ